MAVSIETYVSTCSDALLISLEEEIINGTVPTDSAVHKFVGQINKSIDEGRIKFNENGRHVYVPTVRKMVERELARRYVLAINHGIVQVDATLKQVKADRGQVPGQLSLDLEVSD